jgi:hypothetical protein
MWEIDTIQIHEVMNIVDVFVYTNEYRIFKPSVELIIRR